ncbi:hypothetical protein ACIREM_40905 [Streptomyces shenzhenensis]|uniref:hypothetical protein n=1 Tax=Streptomyces shenzhenensis TaxID=943815 RepID=UPI0037F769C1
MAEERSSAPVQRPDISFDEQRAGRREYVESYRSSEETFLLRATLKALACDGVVTTAGWREGLRTTLVRAIECNDRHQHVHTHYARSSEVPAAMEFAERRRWMPSDYALAEPWSYERVPDLVTSYAAGDIDTYFPLISVSPD